MTGTSTKKRKQANVEANVPAKKARKDRHQKMDLKSKGKEKETEFHVVKTSVVLSIPPTFASHPRAGVEEMLDSMVMRHVLADYVARNQINSFLDTSRRCVEWYFLIQIYGSYQILPP